MRQRTLTAALAIFALAFVPGKEILAQGGGGSGIPTRAGTVIENKATVTWLDANGNEGSEEASVALEVAYVPGVEVESGLITPEEEVTSPSTGNQFWVRITNVGNDSAAFHLNLPDVDGVTYTNFELEGDDGFAATDLNGFNDVLTSRKLDYRGNADGNIDNHYIVVTFDVEPDAEDIELPIGGGEGGEGGEEDDAPIEITPSPHYEIVVEGPEIFELSHLPSGDTPYEVTFTVTNSGSSAEYSLATITGGSANEFLEDIEIVIDGEPVSDGKYTLGNGVTEVVVRYRVQKDAEGGSTGELGLEVTHPDDSSVSDDASVEITVVRPALSIDKSARTSSDINAAELREVDPEDVFFYVIVVKNTGSEIAKNVKVEDLLPDEVTYIGHGDPDNAWNITVADGKKITATLRDDGDLSPDASAWFWIKVRVK